MGSTEAVWKAKPSVPSAEPGRRLASDDLELCCTFASNGAHVGRHQKGLLGFHTQTHATIGRANREAKRNGNEYDKSKEPQGEYLN